MNTKVFFRFIEHPRDLFRNTDLTKLPDINKDFDDFLIQFLPNYQSDETVAYLGDLYKLYYDEFENGMDKNSFANNSGLNSKDEIKEEIYLTKYRLKHKALDNFYTLIFLKKIEIIESV